VDKKASFLVSRYLSGSTEENCEESQNSRRPSRIYLDIYFPENLKSHYISILNLIKTLGAVKQPRKFYISIFEFSKFKHRTNYTLKMEATFHSVRWHPST
jgi:hypothetical protein